VELERVRRFSAAARRLLAARPALEHKALRPPPVALLSRLPADLDEATARRAIRRLRQRTFVHTCAAELAGTSPMVTGALWSRLAEASIALADRVVFRDVTARHGVPVDADGAPIGRVIFALGKLGAGELNPSSDVDLLFAYGTDDGGSGGKSAHEIFVRWVRGVRSLLADVDEDGFGFRVDLDLRPEGTTGALANSLDALESYYERFGRTWERAALARLRAVVDHGGVGAQTMRGLRPFVFPRSIDMRAVEELADMKRRVTAAATSEGFDVKRGEGGIREVEFVVQALQLLYGGRMPELRAGTTLELVERLEERGLLRHRDAAELTHGYIALRRVEHALQYVEDRQTQHLPDDGPTRSHVAKALSAYVTDPLSRARRRPGFELSLKRHRRRVHRVFGALLGESRGEVSAHAAKAVERTAPDDERHAALSQLGFEEPEDALRLVRILERRPASPWAPAQASARGPLGGLGARLLEEVAYSPDPKTALARLPDLFGGFLPATAFARLAEDARQRSLLVRVLATSAPLSRMMSRHASLQDVLLHSSGARRLSSARLAELLAEVRSDDEEEALAGWRRTQAQVVLRTGVAFLAGGADVVRAGHRLSSLAAAILEEALVLARAKVAARFGEPAAARFAVLALGRLGGRELGFFADVDLVFVYDAQGETSGPRALSAGEWAARVAQQIIWSLSVPLVQGRCYEVDTRLRPSGNQGPLCTRIDAFVEYHATRAELWERQSLLRLRAVAGDRALGREVERRARATLAHAAPAGLGTRLLDMRARMVSERAGPAGTLDLKMGEGGLADIEFAVQGLQLAHAGERPEVLVTSTRRALSRLARVGALDAERAQALRSSYDLLTRAREAVVLVNDQRSPVLHRGDHRLDVIARAHRGLIPGEEDGEPTGDAVFDALLREAARVRELAHRTLVRL
jgi:glutamate-ammonia-ligase adenylyltransferase